jgi:uncharacterized protein with PIN domain
LNVCLDSWAVLAWLDGEQPACAQVERFLDARPVMSWVNAVEVAYRVERDHGRPAADEVVADIRRLLELELPGVSRMLEVARLKALLPIALGDCFAVATAASHNASLMTGDPEILSRVDLPCDCIDVR